MMKKIFSVILISLLFLFLAVNLAQANGRTGCPTEGLVPCGTEGCPCTICDFFVMIERIIDFLLFKIVPALAALMIAIGGGMYIIAADKPEMLSQAKKLFASIAIGLVIIYGAWLIVNLFFMVIGLSTFGLELTGPDKWFKIECP